MDRTTLTTDEPGTEEGGRSVGSRDGRGIAWSAAAVLALAVVLRLAVWAAFDGVGLQIWDERDYNTLAQNLLANGQFGFEPGVPTSLRPPLYPALVAGIYGLAGLENFQAVRLYQVLLGLVIVGLTGLLARDLYGPRVGRVAALLAAVYPSLAIYTGFVLTELQFTTLLLAGVVCVVRAYRGRPAAWMTAAGVCLALGALTRSALWPFPVVMGVYLLAAWPGPIRQRLALAAVFGLAFAAVLAPWSVRNTRLQGTFTVVDVMGGRNLMMGNYEYTPTFRAWAAIEEQGPQSWYNVLAQADPESKGVSQGLKDKRAMRHGLRYIASHPIETMKRDLVKFANFWGLEREVLAGVARGFYGDLGGWQVAGLTAVILGSYIAATLLGVFGAWTVPSAQPRAQGFVVLVMAVLCGAHTLTFGHSRYHLPLMPLVLVFAAAALVQRDVVVRAARTWPFRVALAMAGLLLVVWTLELAVVYRDNVAELLNAIA